MKVCQSRKSTHSIMGNGGKFSHMVIRRGNFAITVPDSYLFSDGSLKKYAIKTINRIFNKLEKQASDQQIFSIKDIKIERVDDIA